MKPSDATIRQLHGSHVKNKPCCESCSRRGQFGPAQVCDFAVDVEGVFQSYCRRCHNDAKPRIERRMWGGSRPTFNP